MGEVSLKVPESIKFAVLVLKEIIFQIKSHLGLCVVGLLMGN